MAKMIFEYAVMNSGKTLKLLQFNYNYTQNRFNTLVLKPSADTRDKQITTRLGNLSIDAEHLSLNDSILDKFTDILLNNDVKAVLVDEAQFLSKKQVLELREIVDIYDIDVLAFGLRTNFMGDLFEGSAALMARSDTFKESKTICHCGKKATMVLKIDENQNVIKEGIEIDCGAEEKYISVCHKHWFLGEVK